MTVAIIDYGSGNLRSAAKAFERAAREAGLRTRVRVTAEPEQVRAAERVVLPGVGAFAHCYRGLDGIEGMVEALSEAAIARARPFLGICVGMQLMASFGREHGRHPGLGWIPGEVVALEPADPGPRFPYKAMVPHMGWNALEILAPDHPVLATCPEGRYLKFVLACVE